ncbi:SsgA family sporulation/cell division regulator [Kitasatospora sp. NBC_00085]|uniref:SsgA family sporulation/cell division regulator n=1 Tax=unclassified Kitasatospora TaxID=2633591 RepID=UPI002F919DE2
MNHLIEDVVEACILGPAPQMIRICARYASDDPLALTLGFPARASVRPCEDVETEWTAARDLFAAGLEALSGHGDIRVGPWEEGYTQIQIHGTEGCALVVLRTDELARFLDRTYRAVPAGEESSFIDCPDTVAELLGDRS